MNNLGDALSRVIGGYTQKSEREIFENEMEIYELTSIVEDEQTLGEILEQLAHVRSMRT